VRGGERVRRIQYDSVKTKCSTVVKSEGRIKDKDFRTIKNEKES